MNRTAAHHNGINTNVGLVVLGYRAQDAWIFGEIPLGQGRHHTSGIGTCDTQVNLAHDSQRVANPGIFNEVFSLPAGSITMLGRNRRTSKRPVGL
jgi:hypothetical protein